MIAELFVALLVAHLVGDWLVQSDYMAQNKSVSWQAMAQHIASYHLILLIMLGLVWPADTSQWYAFIIFLVSAVTHSFLDRRWPVVWFLKKTGKVRLAEQTWGVFVVDQSLHIIILSVLALVFGSLA